MKRGAKFTTPLAAGARSGNLLRIVLHSYARLAVSVVRLIFNKQRVTYGYAAWGTADRLAIAAIWLFGAQPLGGADELDSPILGSKSCPRNQIGIASSFQLAGDFFRGPEACPAGSMRKCNHQVQFNRKNHEVTRHARQSLCTQGEHRAGRKTHTVRIRHRPAVESRDASPAIQSAWQDTRAGLRRWPRGLRLGRHRRISGRAGCRAAPDSGGI